MRTQRSILVFAPQRGDHTPNHIQWLVEGWQAADMVAPLHFVVGPGFRANHSAVAAAEDQTGGQICFAELQPVRPGDIGAAFHGEIIRSGPRWRRYVQTRLQHRAEWQQGAALAARVQARHCLVLNFDLYQMAWLLGNAFPCALSGIYHRLLFHYPTLFASRLTRKERLLAWLQQRIADRISARQDGSTLFSFDPFAASQLAVRSGAAAVLPLPMAAILGSTTGQEVADLRARYGLEDGRRVFLLLGAIRAERGFYPLLTSLYKLPASVARQMCLLVVGGLQEPARMQTLLDQARQATDVQIISRNEFIPVAEIPTHHVLADVVLVTHTRHIGISESLAHAAAAGRPLLASDFGLLGELVRRDQLGQTVDCRSPAAIARGITAYVTGERDGQFDRGKAAAFAAANNTHRFAQTLIEHLQRV